MVYDHRARAHLRAQFWRASYAWLQQCGDGGSLTQNKGPVKTMRLFCDLVRERERGRERERERECCYTSSGGGLVLGRALHEKSRGECSARPGSRNCNRLLFDARENFLSLSLSLCFSLFHFCPDLDKKESLEKRIFYLPKIGPGPPFLEKRLLAFPLSLPLSLSISWRKFDWRGGILFPTTIARTCGRVRYRYRTAGEDRNYFLR